MAPLVNLCGWCVRLLTPVVTAMCVAPSGSDADWTYEALPGRETPEAECEPLWAYRYVLESGQPTQWIGRLRGSGDHILRFAEVCEFRLGRHRVRATILDAHYAHMAELRMIGYALAARHELSGTPVLHGSCIVTPEGRGILVCGSWRAGKTTVALRALRAGCRLVSDDIVPLEVRGDMAPMAIASYPESRVWPADVRALGLDPEALVKVLPHEEKRRLPIGRGFGTFHPDPVPVALVVLLERVESLEDGEMLVDRLRPAEAVVGLSREVFLEHIVDALGWRERHFRAFARVADAAPILRLRHNARLHGMERVVEAVLEAESASARAARPEATREC